jgi:hypothetical protein
MQSRELVSTFAELLGQQLTGEIERDRVRAVSLDDIAQSVGDAAERGVPVHRLQITRLIADERLKQPRTKREGLSECGALGAQAAEICGVLFVASDLDAGLGRARDDAAADTAIGACRANFARDRTEDSHDLPCPRL